MNRDEFKKLLTDFGNINFYCGDWRDDESTSSRENRDNYRKLSDKSKRLMEKILEVFDELTND